MKYTVYVWIDNDTTEDIAQFINYEDAILFMAAYAATHKISMDDLTCCWPGES